MTNRFRGKQCVLCSNPSVGVGEHVWPKWLIGDFRAEGPFHSERSGTPYTKRDDVTVAKFAALPGVHVPMCLCCNGRLNRLVEEPARPVVRRVMPWTAAHVWPVLSADEAAILARWFLKVGLLLSHPEAVDDNPHVSIDRMAAALPEFRADWAAWMAGGVDPPDDFSVYVSRRSFDGDKPWAGEKERLLLPGRVEVAGRELRFMTWSLGVRGLDVAIVWHPGWPIRHPLVDQERAGILWPHPTGIDLSRLPEVHPQEFGFVVESASLILNEAQYADLARAPLKVGRMAAEALLGEAGDPVPGQIASDRDLTGGVGPCGV